MGAWQNGVKTEMVVRTKMEMEGRRIPLKLEGWRAEAQTLAELRERRAEGLTGRHGDMGLEARCAARRSTSQHQAGGEVVQSGAENLEVVSGERGAKELRDISGVGKSREIVSGVDDDNGVGRILSVIG